MRAIAQALRLLDLNSDATPEDVSRARRDLAMVWHPDRFHHNARLHRKAEEKLKAINEAYHILQGYTPIPVVRIHPSHTPSAQPHTTGTHSETQVKEQHTTSSPFEPSKNEDRIPHAPTNRFRIPLWVTITGIIVALGFIDNPFEDSNIEQYQQPHIINTLSTPAQHQPDPSLPEEPFVHLQDGFPFTPQPDNTKQQEEVSPARLPVAQVLPPEHIVNTIHESFTIGSTKDTVLRIQGMPTKVTRQVWKFGSSSVFFQNDKVVSWNIWPSSPLKVQIDHE